MACLARGTDVNHGNDCQREESQSECRGGSETRPPVGVKVHANVTVQRHCSHRGRGIERWRAGAAACPYTRIDVPNGGMDVAGYRGGDGMPRP
jgi:hypothetical protein